MRFELLLVALAACAPPLTSKCEPVSASWAAPVYRCDGTGSAAVTPTPDAAVGSGSATNAIEVAAASKVSMKGDDVVLEEPIEFGGDDTVADGSTPVLDDLGALMADHPEITRLDVTVHAKTKKGAEKRAAMIKKYLIEHKTTPERINAKGDKGKDNLEIKVGKRKRK